MNEIIPVTINGIRRSTSWDYAMKSCAEQALGHSILRATVTHPAYFDRGAVEETREAAIAAGFDMSLPEQMLMEPLAAALAYTRSDSRDPLRILTYDMGGGTFDVAYLERREGVIDMRAFDGNHLLGGYNFDRELVHWILKCLKERGRKIALDENSPEDRGRLARMLRLAESVKIPLASALTVSSMVEIRGRDILIDVDNKPIQINERISREQFEDLIKHHLEDAVECCLRTLKKAGVEAGELDEILLVGGSTYGPWIAESLLEAFPEAKPKLFNPDLCVGAGAAIYAKMVLPPLVQSKELKLILDVPDSSVLDMLNITGFVATLDDKPASNILKAVLQLPDGGVLEPVTLDKDGRFMFEDIELTEEEHNEFYLEIMDHKGILVIKHTFEIRYAPETTETSGFTTVLPRPLFIETIDGLFPLAVEGEALPAKCNQCFQRLNDNPNITLKLYQEQYSIGEVRIKNIPPEGGRGSFVELELEITEKNHIRGNAKVRTHEGKVVAQSKILVHLEMPEILSAVDLKDWLNNLKDLSLKLAITDKMRRKEIKTKGVALIKRVEHLFEQQPLERNEIQIILKELDLLFNPPEDDMKPTIQEFYSMVEESRLLIQELKEKAQKIIDKSQNGAKDTLDRNLLSNANKSLQKTKYYIQVLDKINLEGLEAHSRRDRRTWARIHEAISELQFQLYERPNIESPPTVINKLLADFEISQQFVLLEEKEMQLVNKGIIDDWLEEIDRIRSGLENILYEIDSIDDTLPDDQGYAQIHRLLSRTLIQLKEAIRNLGVDIRKG